jgi:hypothetical protein
MAKAKVIQITVQPRKEEETIPFRDLGFYKVRNSQTASSYGGSDFEIAYWNGRGWTVLGWDIIEKNSFFEVIDENHLT